MRRKHWRQLQERKKNNRGSSIVTVIVVMVIVAMIATLVMTMALSSFRMKHTNLGAQKNFYTAETALEEIRQGLCDDMSKAMSEAYVNTVQKYDVLDASAREVNFKTEFFGRLKTNLGYRMEDGTYNGSYLKNFLKETSYDDTTGVGAKVQETDTHANITADSIELKGVSVTYYGEGGYRSEIKTDICLECPRINFSQSSQMPDLTMFALLTDENMEIETGSTCEIFGNAYLGRKETVVNHATLKLEKGSDSTDRGMIVSGSMIKGENGATLDFSDTELWTKNLVVDSSALTTTDTAVYLKNDFVLNNSLGTSSSASMAGELYGYGNMETAGLADSAQEASLVINDDDKDNIKDEIWTSDEKKNHIAENPADYSSSILINGTRASLDLRGLEEMKISGNAYINGKEKSTEEYKDNKMNIENVPMGASLSIRSDQVAYLVPPECIAPGMENGGINPMPIERYTDLLNELKEKVPTDKPGEYLVDIDCETKKYGATLKALGVPEQGWQLEALSVAGVGSMVYVFLKFDSTQKANEFFRNYYDSSDTVKLKNLLDLYGGTDGIHLPEKVLNQTADARFYFNGNLLASDAASLYVPDKLTEINADLKAEQIQCQDKFAALNTKLMKEYIELTEAEKRNTVYQNLVKEMVSADTKYHIPADSHKLFTRATGEAAVVVNGDYTIDATTITPEPGQTLRVVIANGNIDVKTDFTGILIANGKISVKNSVKLKADAKAAEKALIASNADEVHVYDYLVDGECYAIAGGEAVIPSGYSEERIKIQDYVTYENWSKQ